MIIKNILNKIYIHPFTYVLALLSFITGLYKIFIIMYTIIIIHEIGHIFFAYLFNYEIIKINIYPFGCYSIFNYDINNKFIEELLLFFGGVLFQLILLIFINLFCKNIYTYEIFYNYNLKLLLFNLLPLIPLDGSKIFNIILNKILPFKLSHKLTIYLSYILLIIIIFNSYNKLNILLMCILLFTFIVKEHKNHSYLFNKFLLERYIKNIKFKHNNIINSMNINLMKKYKNNIFILNNRYITEEYILKTRFK